MTQSTMMPFQLERLGTIMQADPSSVEESDGVLNPAAARGPDGRLYLFPRLVGPRNYSRVGAARVRFDDAGNPTAVERLGYALEPTEPYELRPQEGTGGCEDPRVTYVEPLHLYVMAYTAWGPHGPHIALAVSEDLRAWQRLGRVSFAPTSDSECGSSLDTYQNKDGILFPQAVRGPDGGPALALLHRPVYTACVPHEVADARPSIWMSYCALDDVRRDVHALTRMWGHHVLIHPRYPWEEWRIGGGTPPVQTAHGSLLLYHGVRSITSQGSAGPRERPLHQYAAGVLLLDARDPRHVLYRSPAPILQPQTADEIHGVVPHVVFPTGVDERGAGRVDVYYGMADWHIGVARLQVPAQLPATTTSMHWPRHGQRVHAA